MLSVKSLSVGYNKKKVLDKISTTFKEGEITAIIGPNGSGKTTLIKTIAGLLPYSGSIKLNEKELKNMGHRERAKQISYVPQTFNSLLNFTVFEMISMGRYPYSHIGQKITEREIIIKAAEEMEITNILNKPFSHLSGGEQRLVIVTRALAQETNVILLDEPGSFLDLPHSYKLLKLILQLKERGKTVILVTHDLNIASLYSDKVIILKNGNIVKEGAPEEILTFRHILDIFEVEVYYTLYPGTNKPVIAPLRFPIPEDGN